jgi:hypothetical protein
MEANNKMGGKRDEKGGHMNVEKGQKRLVEDEKGGVGGGGEGREGRGEF